MRKSVRFRATALLLAAAMLLFMMPAGSVAYAATAKLNKTKVNVVIGNTTTLKVSGNRGKVKWSVDKSKVVKIKNGKVTALATGSATVTAKVDGRTLKCKVTVPKATISKTSISLVSGKTAKLMVKNIKNYKWSSSNKKVATVKSGVVTAGTKAGTAKITAKAGNTTLTCKVTVTTASLKFSESDLTADVSDEELDLADEVTLKYSGKKLDMTNSAIKWKSSDANAATVSGGVVTLLSESEDGVTITATYKGLSAKIVIYITNDEDVDDEDTDDGNEDVDDEEDIDDDEDYLDDDEDYLDDDEDIDDDEEDIDDDEDIDDYDEDADDYEDDEEE